MVSLSAIFKGKSASAEGKLATIKSAKVEYYKIPLAEILTDAGHGAHTHFEVVAVRVTDVNGVEGVGYTYTGGRGGTAIYTLLEDDLLPRLIGRDVSQVEDIWTDLLTYFHYIGRGGILSFAVSAIDIALWDIRCKTANTSLAKYLGATHVEQEVYKGFIDLEFEGDVLAGKVEGAIAQGFDAVKTKVGRPDLDEDLARCETIRNVLGPDRQLMIDANWAYDTDTAIRFGQAVEKYDISWFEEPISPDEFEEYARIADAINIPLAMGENLHIVEEFGRAIRRSKLKYLQPDCSNIGGITGWLKVADMAKQAGLTICSHGMHELHVSLLVSQPHAGMMEAHSFPIDAYTTHPLTLKDGKAIAPDIPGTGVVFDPVLIGPHLVKHS